MNTVNSMIFGNVTITLKNFKETVGHDDSLPFNATLYINGKKIGDCYNDGWGGCASVSYVDSRYDKLYDKAVAAIAEAEKNVKYPRCLCDVIDEIACRIADNLMEQKFIKKNEKKGLVFKRGDVSLYCIPIRMAKLTMAEIYAMPSGKEFVDKIIKRELEKGSTLLNTNIKVLN